MTLTLDIPDEVSQSLRLPPMETAARLRLELAVSLYAQQILTLGKAAQLAGLNRWELNDLLARRNIPLPYTEADLAHDIAYAGRHQ